MATITGPFGLLPRSKTEITTIIDGGEPAGDFNGRVFLHRDGSNNEIWVSNFDKTYSVIGGGGSGTGTVTIAGAGGLTGDGSKASPLRVDSAGMADNGEPPLDAYLAFFGGAGADVERCKVGPFLAGVVSGDVTLVSDTPTAMKANVVAIRGVGVAATTPTTNQILLYNGTLWTPAAMPSVNLASGVTGTLPVANGGTGANTLTGYVRGNGTSAMTASATIPSTDITGLGAMASVASVTLSGDATGSGTSSIAVTIANDAVTFAKMQNINPKTVLGRGDLGTVGDVTELTAGNTGRNVLAADTPAAARTTLGLGDLAQLSQFPGFTFGHVALTSNTADIGTSWVDVGLTSSSLSAGHYDITLDYRYIINSTTSAYVEFRLVDSLGAVIQDNPGDSIRFAFSTNQASVTLQGTSSVHWVWTAGAGQTFKLQARCTTAGGGTTTPVQLRGSSIGYTIMRWRRVY